MRIGIDYWPASTHAPGVGRYVRELVRALVRLEAPPWLGLYEVGPGPRSVPEDMLGLDGARRPGSLRRLNWRLPRRLVELAPVRPERLLGGCDLFHRAFVDRPPVRRARCAVTLAELPAVGTPGHATALAAAQRLDGIIVASTAAHRAVVERLDVAPERVHVVPVGCEHWMRALGGAPYPVPEEPARVVALGRVDRGRHPGALVRAVDAVHAEGRPLELVFAGRAGDAADELRAALARARIPARWNESPDEAELPALVGGAAVLVHLEREAFTPVTPLEALAAGAAVVASELPPFVEALGDEAEWVPPEAAGDELERALRTALDRALSSARDPAARDRRAALAARFSWERAAALTVEAWRRMLAAPPVTS